MGEKKSDLRLRELKRGTMVAVGENKHIMEFLGVDGMYGRRKPLVGDVVIMGQANQKVSEYGEIIEEDEEGWSRDEHSYDEIWGE